MEPAVNTLSREPWNKCKIVGQKALFAAIHIQLQDVGFESGAPARPFEQQT